METVAAAGRIDVISDVICPWCYIGKRQLERAEDLLEKSKLRFTVAWHPFQLNPDMPAEGVDRQQYRIAKFGSLERSRQMDQRITETAARVGIEFHLEKLTRTPNTVNAHRVIRLGAQKGVQDDVVELLFYGYFCAGADIGDDQDAGRARPQGRAGLRGSAWRCSPSDEGRHEVLAGDEKARHCGIQGVPSFALQGHVLFSGAVPGEEMADTFRRAWELEAAAEGASGVGPSVPLHSYREGLSDQRPPVDEYCTRRRIEHRRRERSLYRRDEAVTAAIHLRSSCRSCPGRCRCGC